jgi:1-deoxy-D-xylulose-5-phosphate synthase
MAQDYGNDFAIISTGRISEEADKAMEILKEAGINGKHINVALIKPIPAVEILDLMGDVKNVFSIEEGIISGGFGESLERELQEAGRSGEVIPFGVKNPVVRAMSPKEQIAFCGLDAESVAAAIKNSLS